MKYLMMVLMVLILAIGLAGKWDMDWAEGNEFHITVTNYGHIGHNVETGNAGGYWPSGYPAENYIYDAGLWLGGLIDSITSRLDTITDTLVTTGNYISEFCPGDGSDAPGYTSPYERVYNSRNDWPPRDINSSIVYDSTVSLFDTYCFYSDKDPFQHLAQENKPLGITVKQNSYQWFGPLLEDVVIIRMVLKNERDDSRDIRNCYFGYVFDSDIGNESGSSANDLVGYIDTMTVDNSLRRVNTVYQYQLESEAGWAHEPGIFSVTLLETPVTYEPIDLYHDNGYFIPPFAQIGLTSLTPVTLASIPATKEEKYQVMAGYDFLTFDPSDPESSYEPFPYWSVNTPGYPGMNEGSERAGDKRFILSTGPFDLAYGDSLIYTFALTIDEYPEMIVPHALSLQEFWNDRNSEITVISPEDSAVIRSDTRFEWSCDETEDSFAISFQNILTHSTHTVKGINNFSHMLDITALDDGYYYWQLWNFDRFSSDLHSEIFHIGIDRNDMNCPPYIESFESKTEDPTQVLFKWHVLDTDNDNHMSQLTLFHNESNDSIKYNASTRNDSLIVNAWTILPNGNYTALLIVSDDHASDTANLHFNLNCPRPEDTLNFISGDNNVLTVSAEIMDSSAVRSHVYYLMFSNPYMNGDNLFMPFSVYDSTDHQMKIRDTIISPCSLYYTDIFDGLYFKLQFDSYYLISNDSIVIFNDFEEDYPDSVFHVTQYSLLGGRDIIIEWHNDNDTIYPAIYCENYEDYPIQYNANAVSAVSYAFMGEDTVPYAPVGEYSLYIGGLRISGLRTHARPYLALFDTVSELPDKLEFWRVYNSGGRMPIEGDVYAFRPAFSSISSNRNDYEKRDIDFSPLIYSSAMSFTLRGRNEYFDISIYDIQGRKVKHIFTGSVNGSKSMNIKTDMPPGIYFIKDNKNPGIYDSKFIILR
ncbi:MAG: T9SS type A sorting domain-containing protein [bacterium]